jgi:hypothetical protein
MVVATGASQRAKVNIPLGEIVGQENNIVQFFTSPCEYVD